MKFKKNTRKKAIEYEKDLVKYWKDNSIFEKSVEQRPKNNSYVFYDGPPFITGVPHHGTLLSSIVKDAVPRFWTMKGKRVERVWGWDCHGLPAEVYTEKKLGISAKKDIGTKISLEDYIKACRENMVQTGSEWEDTIDRIGRWVDFKGAYKTMDADYMESVWWAFKELYEKDKIYEGEKVLMYCTKDATPLAKAEIAMDNSYQDVTDPSVYVKFKLKDKDSSLLAWTTTPWTLPSNSAIAINKDLEYAQVELDGEKLILAEKLREKALTDEKHKQIEHKVLRTFKGSELVGLEYEPLFEPEESLKSQNAFKVWHADFVHDEEGTGIAHESPAYGEEDYDLAKENDIPWVMSTDENGYFTIGDWKGEYVWDINKQIAKDLLKQEKVWKIDYITHSYPHCHRCGTKLMYRAHPSWFMNIAEQRKTMLEQNENITWFPEHIKHGRFEKTVESAPDWNLSRDRFWATPMPVWKSQDGDVKVVGSYAELKQLSGVELKDYHRPWIDEVEFDYEGKHYKRIDRVMDSWFESGSMPFAQFHYPFENKVKFEENFPGDFIAEYVGQVRAWFYYLHSVSVGLFGVNSFKNVVVTGTLAGNDGRKMSKSYGNYTDPNQLMDEYSADALRFLLFSSSVLNGEDFSLQDKDVADVSRKLSMVWNMYDFFTLYADVDGWEYDENEEFKFSELSNPLDRWIVSLVHRLASEVEENMENNDIPNAAKPILKFVDDASNWYVRRSRKRFWKSEDDNDKQDAYKTLHYILRQLALVMAPFTPFLSEELYRNLTGVESVHLLDWPKNAEIDDELVTQMSNVRMVITTGLAERAQNAVKVRQPLQRVSLQSAFENYPESLIEIVREELNVKEVNFDDSVLDAGKSFAENREEDNFQQLQRAVLDFNLTDELRAEGLSREVIRRVQSFRKKSDLEVDDRIKLDLSTDDSFLKSSIEKFAEEISRETLAVELTQEGVSLEHSSKVDIDGNELTICLQKQ